MIVLEVIGWIVVLGVAVWATFAAYTLGMGAVIGWVGRTLPVIFTALAVALWVLVCVVAPFSIHWGEA